MKNNKEISIILPSMDAQRLMILEMETEKVNFRSTEHQIPNSV